jgi:2'-5' RNA ligase
MPIRTFLALDIVEDTRRRLVKAAGEMDAPGSKINWVAPANLHVTLNFLGQVPDERAHAVCEIAQAVAGQYEPFEFRVAGIKVVPPHGPLRMIWADVAEPTGQLIKLQADLSDAFAGLGLREEARAYKPHITLARVKFIKDPHHLRDIASQYAQQDFGAQHAEEVTIYTSHRGPEGSIYTPIAHAELGV